MLKRASTHTHACARVCKYARTHACKYTHTHMPRKWRKRGGKEDQECDERTALTKIWKDQKENGEQQQNIEGVGDC